MAEIQKAFSKAQTALSVGLILVLAIIFLPTPGTADVFDWLAWGENAYSKGIIEGYAANRHEHPPYFTMILYAAVALAKTAGIEPFYGLKISFLVFLLLSTTIIYFWSKKDIALTMIFFVPLAYSCMTLSYMDIYFTPLFLLSIYFISKEKLTYATISFMAAALIKLPPLIVAPFFLIYAFSYIKDKGETKKITFANFFIKVILPPGAMLLITLAIFGNEFYMAIERAFGHNCLSCGALNFNRLFPVLLYEVNTDQNIFLAFTKDTNWHIPYKQNDSLVYSIALVTFILFYISTLAAFLISRKDLCSLLIFSILGYFSYFIFSKGVHENNLYVAMLLAMSLAIINEKYLATALNVILISSMNMFMTYGINGMAFDLWWSRDNYNVEIDSLSWLNAGYPLEKFLIFSLFNVVYFLGLWISVMTPFISRKRTANLSQ